MSKTSKRLTMKSGNNSTYPLFHLYTGKPVIELWNEDRLLNNFLVEASNAEETVCASIDCHFRQMKCICWGRC